MGFGRTRGRRQVRTRALSTPFKCLGQSGLPPRRSVEGGNTGLHTSNSFLRDVDVGRSVVDSIPRVSACGFSPSRGPTNIPVPCTAIRAVGAKMAFLRQTRCLVFPRMGHKGIRRPGFLIVGIIIIIIINVAAAHLLAWRVRSKRCHRTDMCDGL